MDETLFGSVSNFEKYHITTLLRDRGAELGEKEAEGIYANLAMLIHSPTEIIIDFARVMPRMPKSKVLARIIMTPMHAKLLHNALKDNLDKYEKQFGEIKTYGSMDANSNPIGFQSQTNNENEKK